MLIQKEVYNLNNSVSIKENEFLRIIFTKKTLGLNNINFTSNLTENYREYFTTLNYPDNHKETFQK